MYCAPGIQVDTFSTSVIKFHTSPRGALTLKVFEISTFIELS